MLGEGSKLTQLSVGDLDIYGNVAFDSLSVAGNITSGRNFIGNGALMTGVISTLPSRGIIDIVGNVDGTYANVSNLILSSTFIALGENAGADNQQSDAVAVGYQTGYINQGSSAVAMGTYAGRNDQGYAAVALGAYTANYYQGEQSVAVGISAGEQYQGRESVAIGSVAGQLYQGNTAVAIGTNAGNDRQGESSVCIGASAGVLQQGNNSVAIGSYGTARGANSILINATGATIVASTNDAFVVKPVRGSANITNQLMYNTSSGEITYNTTGNLSANYFLGNGSQLTGLASALPGVISEDIIGNIVGTYANVSSVIATTGNVGNVIFVGGNVTAGNLSGQSVFANLITFGVNANVGKMTGLYCVAMNGNDSTADGSVVKPFLTIQAAHDRAWTEYPPVPGNGITKQVEIRVAAGTFESPVTITRYNTVVRGTGSLFGRGTYTSIGQVSVNCANASSLNTSVCLDRVSCLNGVTNTGNGVYTLTIDSCYLTANNATVLSSENDKSTVYVNDTFLSASLAGGNTYVRATGNTLYFYDCTLQTPSGVASGGQFIVVGGNCGISLERCVVNPVSSTNAAIKATSSVPSAASAFKIQLTNSYLITTGPGVDFGTTNTAGSFIRNVNAVVGSNVFIGNGIAYYNQLIILPGTSNTKASTVTVSPFTLF
jgi:hypothetical protein